MGLSLLYMTLGLFQFLQVFLSLAVYVEILDGVFMSPGATVLFSSTLFAILLIYIKEDTNEVRKIISALIIVNVMTALLLFSVQWNLNNNFQINSEMVSETFFGNRVWVIVVGTLLLFLDSLLIVFIYELISKILSNLWLRIYLTMMLVLSFDAILFSMIAFWDVDDISSRIYSGLISKNIIVIPFSIIFTIYLKYIEKDIYQPNFLNAHDVLHSLTYKQKFEKIEKAMVLSETRYQMLTKISPAGIFLTDTEGKIIFVNPSWCKIAGIPQKGAINNKWFESVHPDDIAKVRQKWDRAIHFQEELYNRFRFVHKDGTIILGLSQLIPEFDKSNRLTGFVGTVTDVTNM